MGSHKYYQKVEYTTNTVIKRLTYEETLQVLMSEGHDVNAVVNDAVGYQQQLGLRESRRNGLAGELFSGASDALGGMPPFGVGGKIGRTLGDLGFGGIRKRVAVDFESSGWEMQRKWLETVWDFGAYRIGIDDVGFFSYSYEETGEIVSVEYKSPLPLRKVSLLVDQSIPRTFTEIDPTRSWISYFISVDNGKNFMPIAPESASVLRGDDGEQIKQFININSKVATEDRDPREGYIDTPAPATLIRLKIVMYRPTNIPDADNYSPSARNYRLKLFLDKSENHLGTQDLATKPVSVDTRINS
jgi:hypothetical protein